MPGVKEKPETAGALSILPPQESNMPQPRQPTSLHGLLRFAMEATKAEDAPHNSEFQPMDEERRKFLEEALKSMTIDVIELLQKQIQILRRVDHLSAEDPIDNHVKALETILDYIDNIDISNDATCDYEVMPHLHIFLDFHKIGGFVILHPCLKSVHPKIKAGGCELIAVLCQNNPYCQRIILDNEFVPVLLHLIDTDADLQVSIKALYAISGIVRENVEGFNQLIHYNGLLLLLRALKKNDEKFISKICFLLSSLCRTHPDLKSRLIFLDYVPTLITLISEDRKPSHEHALELLVSLVEENPTAINECKQSKYNFKDILQRYLSNVRNKEEFMEEEQYCKRLLHMLFGY